MNLSIRQTALITGASSGIGYELAKIFARDRYNLVLVARRSDLLVSLGEELQTKFDITVHVLIQDLALPEAPAQIFAELQQSGINIDVLVNNAGFGAYGSFAEIDLTTELQMIQVNMVALTHLTKLLLGNMMRRQRGKILNVASTAAFQPGPLMAVYYATKAYVLSFSEALANELQGSGVTVTVLCPGPTTSGFQQQAAMEESKLVYGKKMMDAATVAEIGYRGLMRHQTVVIPGLKNALLAFGVKFLPRAIVTQLVRQMQERV